MDLETTIDRKPSEQSIHMQYYEKGARERALDIPENVTITDLIRETANGVYRNYPAMIYHMLNAETTVSREKFLEKIDIYAKALDALGVREGECVPVYCPFVPEAGYLMLALIQLGAWGNFFTLDTPKADIELQMSESKVVAVFDSGVFYSHVREAVERDHIERALVISPFDSFDFPYRHTMDFLARFQTKKLNSAIPKTKKFIRRDEVYKLAKEYTTAPKAPSVSDRIALGTGSSRTTGGAKCSMITNRSIISNALQTKVAVAKYNADTPDLLGNPYTYGYNAGQKFLSQWPFVSTSISVLFLMPLLNAMTIICDPLAAYKTELFYKSVFKYCPKQVVSTGPETRRFFQMLKSDKENRSLDFLLRFIVGGDGITNEDYNEFREILYKHGVKNPESVLSIGYGLSECFAALTSRLSVIQIPIDKTLRLVPSVGIPFPATSIGIFDKNGDELGYNHRGYIRVNADISRTVMAGYYLDEKLTESVFSKDKNGVKWLLTKDIGELGSDGQLYYYCREDDVICTVNGTEIYTVDIANYIMHSDETLDAYKSYKDCELSYDEDIRYCYVTKFDLLNNEFVIVAHIVLRNKGAGLGAGIDANSGIGAHADSGTGTHADSSECINPDLNNVLTRINKKLRKYFPDNLIPVGYRIYDDFLPDSMHKTDRKLLASFLDGYVRPSDTGLVSVKFTKDDENGLYSIEENLQENQ